MEMYVAVNKDLKVVLWVGAKPWLQPDSGRYTICNRPDVLGVTLENAMDHEGIGSLLPAYAGPALYRIEASGVTALEGPLAPREDNED